MGGYLEHSFELPRWVTAASLAETCREAGLLFLEGATPDWWGGIELAEWLSGPYHDATRWGRWNARSSSPPPPMNPPREEPDVSPLEHVDERMREARRHVLTALEGLALPGGSHEWVDRALAAGYVAPRRDGEGGVTWVPLDLPGMRLSDRVESLFAADHLARPRAYALELLVCRCETVVFDAEARVRGDCGAHTGYRVEPASRVRHRARTISER